VTCEVRSTSTTAVVAETVELLQPRADELASRRSDCLAPSE
jgi:hypothetical protein